MIQSYDLNTSKTMYNEYILDLNSTQPFDSSN